MTSDPLNLDLGCHRRRCRYSERAKEEVTYLVSYAVPTGRRDCIRDDPDYSVASPAVEGRCAEHIWYCAESCLAGGAWNFDCGNGLQHRHKTIKATHGNRRGLGQGESPENVTPVCPTTNEAGYEYKRSAISIQVY